MKALKLLLGLSLTLSLLSSCVVAIDDDFEFMQKFILEVDIQRRFAKLQRVSSGEASVWTSSTGVEDIRDAARKFGFREAVDLKQQTDLKLKEQASEIKKIKTQLKRAKDKIQQLTGQEEKERAMAAAVPFEQRFEELVHFQRGHGHCRVPCTSKENPGLARWVQTLRAAYKEKEKRGKRYYGQLTDERQKKLVSAW